MRASKLPQEIKELLWKHGLEGKRIYIPKLRSPDLITRHLPLVLMEVEESYHESGITFYLEKSSRDRFSGRFGKNKIASMFKLKLRTSASISVAAWKTWRDWFGHKERLYLEQLRDLAEEIGIEYTGIYFTYLGIREKLRRGEDADIDEAAGYHGVQVHVIQPILDLAKASVASCPWRSSP